MRRFSLNLAALALAAAASAPAANAAFIDFTTTAPGGQVTVTQDGIVGTAIPFTSISGVDTPKSGPAGFGNLTLSFSTGAFQGNLSPTVASYGSDGSTVTITGQDGQGHTVTLFSGSFVGTTQLLTTSFGNGVPELKIIGGGIMGVVNQALDNAYGLSYSGLSNSTGTLSMNLDQNLKPVSYDVNVDPEPLGPPAAVPEPASLALMALGLPFAFIARRRALARKAILA